MSRAALLVLVGPAREDLQRFSDLLDSVSCYEPGLAHCVVIDDGREDRTRELRRLADGRMPATILRHPRRGRPGPMHGALAAGVLTALAFVEGRLDVEFVLKVDLDALIIAPFAERIAAFLRASPDTGIVGCLCETCNPSSPRYRRCCTYPSPFAIALDVLAALPPERIAAHLEAHGSVGQPLRIEHPVIGVTEIGLDEYHAALALRPRIAEAAARGQRTAEYCQGGAYAISRALMHRMQARGMLDEAEQWLPLGLFGEDEILAMYAYAAELRLYDASGPGEPFGIAWSGLPFSPPELIARGHAVIHSLKGDERYTETELRHFFAGRRSAYANTRPVDSITPRMF